MAELVTVMVGTLQQQTLVIEGEAGCAQRYVDAANRAKRRAGIADESQPIYMVGEPDTVPGMVPRLKATLV